MRTSVLKDGFPKAHLTTRERVESSIDLRRLFAVIDADPAIAGAGVVYLDAQLWPVTLREFQPICSVLPKRVILREMPTSMARLDFVRRLEHEPRESRLVFEAINTSLSCGAAVLGWIVVLSGSVAIPFTAGVSSFVVAAGVSAAIASSAQCAIGAVRTFNEQYRPAENDHMDDSDWYNTVSPILDGVSLIGIGTGTLTTVRLLKASKKSLGKSWYELLKGLTRQERKKLTNELLTLRDPGLTTKILKLKRRAGRLPKRYSSDQMRHATLTQLKDVLGGMLGLAGSYQNGHVGSAATIVIGLYEEIAE
ncbi:NAD synthetase [Pseudomonas fluorescens]|nr:NAD synthetase [Pseudomonas fluorescens]OPB10889.1 NAD synthetase [Pseudomonas fluorescens]OPB22536.1 NAD synthetase [Pseudomonas fluorescens]